MFCWLIALPKEDPLANFLLVKGQTLVDVYIIFTSLSEELF